MRRRLIAIPSSNSPVGIRVDWSPLHSTLVLYAWRSVDCIHSWHLQDIINKVKAA